jgi:hypothetical protein
MVLPPFMPTTRIRPSWRAYDRESHPAFRAGNVACADGGAICGRMKMSEAVVPADVGRSRDQGEIAEGLGFTD